ncbi:MAG: restriction endonuclease [Burkholderiaceae bacterium]|nr:restriction endonuclease [Burkholderiaceae bacterium]
MTQAVGDGLRIAGWPAIGVGLVMVGIHFLMKRMRGQASQAPVIVQKVIQTQHDPWLAPLVSSQTPAPPASIWCPAIFAAIDWQRFEALCDMLFAQAGFETRSQSHGAEGGVAIWLHSSHAQGPVSIVQCKHWHGKPVGVKDLREFYGVMTSHQLQRGTYVTTSAFTGDALQFAKDNGIIAMNGTKLLALMASRTPEQQQALMAVAFEGDDARPT